MVLTYFDKGACQVVFEGDSENYIYKLPIKSNYFNNKFEIILKYRSILKLFDRNSTSFEEHLFENSISILKTLEKQTNYSLCQFFPKTTIIKTNKIKLLIGGKEFLYTGDLIKQEKVDIFYKNNTPLNSFNWQDIVDIELELWKYGVGLGASAETWGPKNWGKLRDKTTKLVDTSHLTTNLEEVSSRLSDEVIEFRRKQLLTHYCINSKELVNQYLHFMRTFLNTNKLKEYWRSNLQ